MAARSTGWPSKGRSEHRIAFKSPLVAQGGTRETGKNHLDSLGSTREAPGRFIAQDCRSNSDFGRAPDFV